MLLDEVNEELYTEAIAGHVQHHRHTIGQCIAGLTVKRGDILNVDRSDPDWASVFDDKRYKGINSELCVPLFNSSRKCLGVIKCINKQNAANFDEEDVMDVTRFANDLAIMLEEDGGIKRVLNLTRQRMQQKDARGLSPDGKYTILCYLERAKNLPDNADLDGVGIDP